MLDLDLDFSVLRSRAVAELTGQHELLAILAADQWPDLTARPARLGSSTAVLDNFHRGLWCGLTWYDPDLDLLWLCYVGYHRPDDRATAHLVFDDRDLADRLLPTLGDYRDLDPDPAAFVARLGELGAGPLGQAREEPGKVVRVDLGGLAALLLVEPVTVVGVVREQVWVAFTPTGSLPLPIPPDWLQTALAALLPTAHARHLHNVNPADHAIVPPGLDGLVASLVCWRPWDPPPRPHDAGEVVRADRWQPLRPRVSRPRRPGGQAP
jgi:hypothetical protein